MGFHARDLARLPQAERSAFLDSLTHTEQEALQFLWEFWARPNQLIPPGNWTTWLPMAGRGWGKTRVGAETTRQWVKRYKYVNLIGATSDDVRQIMIEGESGILNICPKDERPRYIANQRKLAWPNGAVSLLFSADEPERLRGKQSMKLWADELAAWRYPQAWDQAAFGLRLGDNPQAIVTTTPRPTKIMQDLVSDPNTLVTHGSTYENAANLAESFLHKVVRKYEGTRLGRQELNAELLADVPGALWTREMFEKPGFRLRKKFLRDLVRIVVAVDPSGTKGEQDDSKDGGDDIGIVVAGLGNDGRGYVLADHTCNLSPADWGAEAVAAYKRYRADTIIGEGNFGGAMIEHVIHTADNTVPYKMVTASRGKIVRAEPVAALYEQGRISHVGLLPQLEDQLCGFTANGYVLGGSPDRGDAMVWAITELMLGSAPSLMDVL